MSVFHTKESQELATIRKIEKDIERRQRIHKLIMGGIAGMMAICVASHLVCRKHRR